MMCPAAAAHCEESLRWDLKLLTYYMSRLFSLRTHCGVLLIIRKSTAPDNQQSMWRAHALFVFTQVTIICLLP